MMKSAIDLHDLTRGEGEWRNMQDIVRRTFRACVEYQNQQSDQITKLTSQVSNLKEELHKRPSWEDIERFVDMKMMSERKHSTPQSQEIDQLKFQIANLRKDLEKKVSIQHLETSMSKKLDRTDILVRDLTRNSLKEYTQDIAQMKLDLVEVKSTVDHFSDMMETFHRRDAELPRNVTDITVLRSQVENLYRHIADIYTKEQLKHVLEDKIGRLELDTILTHKADASVLYSFTARLEQALEQHEKLITSLRLSASDPSLFQQDVFMRKTARTTGETMSASASVGGKSADLDDLLKDGRIESVVTGLWHKVTALLKEFQHVRKEIRGYEDEIKSFRHVVKNAAALDKVEVLGAVVEEQRLRIDSLISGSTKIPPLQKELRRFDQKVKDIEGYLQLPQGKNLQTTLQEMSALVEDVSKGLVDVGSAVHGNVLPKLEVMHTRTDVIETRMETVQHDQDRIAYLIDHTDLAGTKFQNVRDLGHSLYDLWNEVDSARFARKGADEQPCVRTRLRDVEEHQHTNAIRAENNEQRILHLKEVLLSLSAGNKPLLEALKETRYKAPESRVRGDTRNTPSSSSHNHYTSGSSSGIAMGNRESTVQQEESPGSSASDESKFTREALGGSHSHSHAGNKQGASVDFEAVLGQLFHSLEDMKIPIRANHSSPVRRNATKEQGDHDIFMMSITEVDQRLEQLNKDKQRLRQMLLSKV